MQRWTWVVASLLLVACGGGSGGSGDAAWTDGRPDLAPGAEVGPDAVPPGIDARPAVDAPADAAGAGPAVDSGPVSACLKLAAQTLPGGNPAPPQPAVLGDPTKLKPEEIAGRLSRFIWRMEPDAPLLARVQGCDRLSLVDVQALSELMLRDPRAARGIQAFVGWWLELDRLPAEQRDPTAFPAFTDELRRSMAEEPRLFAAHVVFNDTGTLPRLLTAPYTFVDRHLAGIYDRPAIDDTFRRIDFQSADQRAGLLTMPGVLAVSGGFDRHSGPVRGKRLLERVLCRPVPPPPALATPEIPPPSARPGQSLRQAMEKTMDDPACAGCHVLLEIGFGFEPFDAIGRHRTTDNGAPIDAHVLHAGFLDLGIAASGPVDLVTMLAQMDVTRRCFAERWLEFGVGPLTERDQIAVVDALNASFARAGMDIRALIAQVTLTAPFLAIK